MLTFAFVLFTSINMAVINGIVYYLLEGKLSQERNHRYLADVKKVSHSLNAELHMIEATVYARPHFILTLVIMFSHWI